MRATLPTRGPRCLSRLGSENASTNSPNIEVFECNSFRTSPCPCRATASRTASRSSALMQLSASTDACSAGSLSGQWTGHDQLSAAASCLAMRFPRWDGAQGNSRVCTCWVDVSCGSYGFKSGDWVTTRVVLLSYFALPRPPLPAGARLTTAATCWSSTRSPHAKCWPRCPLTHWSTVSVRCLLLALSQCCCCRCVFVDSSCTTFVH